MTIHTSASVHTRLVSRAPRVYRYGVPEAVSFVHKHTPLQVHVRYLQHLENVVQPFLTSDPDEADLFFVPWCLAAFQFADTYQATFPKRPAALSELLQHLTHLDRGRHVFLATGDFGQRQDSRHQSMSEKRAYPVRYSWLDERINLLAFESEPDLLPQDVGILAAPLKTKTPRRWARGRVTAERDLLYSFAGAMSYDQLPAEHIRGGRLYDLAAFDRADTFVGTARQARERFGRHGGKDTSMLLRSRFTLSPSGYGRWTFRLGQALRYGSIPVVLGDDYLLPHSDFVDWEACAVVVPEGDLLDLPDLLRSVSEAEVRDRQRAIREHHSLFTPRTCMEMSLVDLLARVDSQP